MRNKLSKLKNQLLRTYKRYKKQSIVVIVFMVLLIIYFVFKSYETVVIHQINYTNDSKARGINDRLNSEFDTIYRGKEQLVARQMDDLANFQKGMEIKLSDVAKTLSKLMENNKNSNGTVETTKEVKTEQQEQAIADIKYDDPVDDFRADIPDKTSQKGNNRSATKKKIVKKVKEQSVISFNIKARKVKKRKIILPAGSYVKGTVLTGRREPEKETYPVLIQLDYAYIIPNKKKLDLSGCFVLTKAQGSLSAEEVKMQLEKLSCVSEEGELFEKKINGYVADGIDNSFGINAEIISKQDRVAAMSFISSIAEGVGKALQFAQTTQMTNSSGGSSSIVSGDKGKYLVGAGVSNAASQVTRWYLKQAESLLPKIKINSGIKIYAVMLESVELPLSYFKNRLIKRGNKDVFNYIYSAN